MRPTIMKISTDAIAANARAIRAHIPESVRMMCVVKADAYGHDSVHTAKKLRDAGADAFAVAIVEEAEALARRCASGYPRQYTRPGCWRSCRMRLLAVEGGRWPI